MISESILRVPLNNLKTSLLEYFKANENGANTAISVTGMLIKKIKEKKSTSEEKINWSKVVQNLQKLQQITASIQEPVSIQENLIKLKDRYRFLVAELDIELCTETFVANFLAQIGSTTSAAKLAGNYNPLTDISVFKDYFKLKGYLKAHDLNSVLCWSIKNGLLELEFELHLFKFRLFCEDNKLEAVEYGRKALKKYVFAQDKKQKMLTALMSLGKSDFSKVDVDWNDVENLFEREFQKYYGIYLQSDLQLLVDIGLSVLKSNNCVKPLNMSMNVEDEGAQYPSMECPPCQPTFKTLAENLPSSSATKSEFICRITGRKMTQDNPPMALPNGQVFSSEALEKIAQNDNGNIVCPITTEKFTLSQITRVYLI